MALRAEIAELRATITYWDTRPTTAPTPTITPTETSNFTQESQTGDFLTQPEVQPTLGPSVGNLVATSAAPIPEPTIAMAVDSSAQQQSQLPSGPRVVRVDASLSVSADGCAMNPASGFTTFDTIYGVVTVADMQSGNTLSVQFISADGSIIYEDGFTVTVPGSFCRWYTIEPDSEGWMAGTYTISYTINNGTPVSTTYTIS